MSHPATRSGRKASRWKRASARIKSASAPGLEPNAPVDVVAEGTFELKGVRKSIEVPARITYVPKGGPFSQMRPGNFVRLTARFDFKLAESATVRSCRFRSATRPT